MTRWPRSAWLRARKMARSVWAVMALTLVVGSTLAPTPTGAEEAAQAADPRFFAQTGYRISNDPFWDFFEHRGRERTFGFPVSDLFTFQGCQVQFFQRLIMQQCGSAGVSLMNLLDAGLMPYTRINGSTFPAADPAMAAAAPRPSDPDYDTKILEYIQSTAPDVFEGEPVNFFSTFQNTVSMQDVFGDAEGDPNLLLGFNLQLWGVPTSAPMRDPANADFIYQRFQRGIMHYDKSCDCTQGLLLADYLKSIMTGQNLPADLREQALGNPLYLSAVSGNPPPGTIFGNAFGTSPLGGLPQPAVPTATPSSNVPPVTPPVGGPAQLVPSPDYGLSMFLWGRPQTTTRDLQIATSAGFRWQKTLFQWRLIEGKCKGCFDWSESDRVVKASNAAGIKILARLDFQPGWTGVPESVNGPPRNYQDYYDFISAFVSRYKTGSPNGQVQAIEIWNEVNLDREWGNQPINRQQAADYVRLLGGSYAASKAVDPNVIVVTAGLSPTGVTNGQAADDVEYLGWLYDAGMKGKFDVLGAHGNTQAPEVDAPLNSLPGFPHPSFYFRRVEQLRETMVRYGDADKQIWFLEFGWTSDTVNPAYSWFAVSEEKKAQNLVRAYQYARENWSPWMGVMIAWTMSDAAWTPQREEYWWAITNPDGTPRPAYTAIKNARANGTLP